MLLLKYPSPGPPNGPQTFVDDAIYLRDNFSAAGGANIITNYSGRSPHVQSSSRLAKPLEQSISPRQRLHRTISPLHSPARFLQQQGGIEALFQGATKGVFERGEKLGINQAVRDAVGEVKKNMQGLQAARTNPASRRTSDVTRWSLDEGRPSSHSEAAMLVMNKRNQQLARMLSHAMSELRAVSIAENGDKEKYVQAMDVAIAKVEFVKIYLEDSTMPLPSEPSEDTTPTNPRPVGGETTSGTKSIASRNSLPDPPPMAQTDQEIKETPGAAVDLPLQVTLRFDPVAHIQEQTIDSSTMVPPIISKATDSKPEPDMDNHFLVRPKAPVPTRSTIAHSSFSWMLEPDSVQPMIGKSSPPKSSSPFLKSGKRPSAGPGREKPAFLFGDEGGEIRLTNARLASLVDADEGFKLGTIRGRKAE
jgi:TBC1 domain family protein 5